MPSIPVLIISGQASSGDKGQGSVAKAEYVLMVSWCIESDTLTLSIFHPTPQVEKVMDRIWGPVQSMAVR